MSSRTKIASIDCPILASNPSNLTPFSLTNAELLDRILQLEETVKLLMQDRHQPSAKITAGMVRTLRERSECGLIDCKNALAQAKGNMDHALFILTNGRSGCDIEQTVTKPYELFELMQGLLARNKIRKAMAIIYEEIDRWASKGDHSCCDDFLDLVQPEQVDTVISISILTITSFSKDHLQNRDRFCQRVREHLYLTDPDRAAALLDGL